MINRTFSLYLDLIRATAAITVFLGHASSHRISGGVLWQLHQFGELAVDVFFVLSGFVIALVTSDREKTPTDYAVSRCARIYSVAIPAIIISIGLDLWCRTSFAQTYVSALPTDLQRQEFSLANSMLSVLFLNNVWFLATTPGANGPYWSLCFEIWYYVAFGMIVFLRGHVRLVAVSCICLIVGPKIIALFPVWLTGAVCFYSCRRIRMQFWIDCVAVVAPVFILIWWYPGAMAERQYSPFQEFVPSARWFVDNVPDYVVGVLFAVHLYGVHDMSLRHPNIMGLLSKPIRFLAGASFTIYILHYPLLYFVVAVSPWSPSDWQTRICVFVVVPLTLLAVAEVTEKRKSDWRRLFVWLFGNATRARVA